MLHTNSCPKLATVLSNPDHRGVTTVILETKPELATMPCTTRTVAYLILDHTHALIQSELDFMDVDPTPEINSFLTDLRAFRRDLLWALGKNLD